MVFFLILIVHYIIVIYIAYVLQTFYPAISHKMEVGNIQFTLAHIPTLQRILISTELNKFSSAIPLGPVQQET